MNFIVASIELKEKEQDSTLVYGHKYLVAHAVIPTGNAATEVRLRLLCYENSGKAQAFKDWAEGSRALVSGDLVFGEDTNAPLDVIISKLETNVAADTYCNQILLGNAFFASNDVKTRNNGTVAVKVGTTLDNSETTTWMFLEFDPSRKGKIDSRIRSGRELVARGHLREYRKQDSEGSYRALVCDDFTTRKDRGSSGSSRKAEDAKKGYAGPDPLPDF